MAVDRSQRIQAFLDKLPDVKPKRISRPSGIDKKLFQAFLEITTFHETHGRKPSLDADEFKEKSLGFVYYKRENGKLIPYKE